MLLSHEISLGTIGARRFHPVHELDDVLMLMRSGVYHG